MHTLPMHNFEKSCIHDNNHHNSLDFNNNNIIIASDYIGTNTHDLEFDMTIQ